MDTFSRRAINFFSSSTVSPLLTETSKGPPVKGATVMQILLMSLQCCAAAVGVAAGAEGRGQRTIASGVSSLRSRSGNMVDCVLSCFACCCYERCRQTVRLQHSPGSTAPPPTPTRHNTQDPNTQSSINRLSNGISIINCPKIQPQPCKSGSLSSTKSNFSW